EKLRDGLIHMIAHDMKSPLMVIMGSLEMVKMQLEKTKEGTDSLIKYIYGASNSAIKITNMISNMLDISKIEAKQMTLQLYKISLKQIVSQTIQMFDFIKGERILTFEQSDEIPNFISDPNIIQRICQNLIDNAIKFTDQKSGKINVCIKKVSDDRVKVSISDNGHGIPLEYHEKIFDKFFQVESKKQIKVHSTGLGMAFCKLATEAIGGTIGVESEVEKGSTFWFELPF
ncbi:MAG: HAMP domain-containing histidine kinase, partial [Desulfamplus sp.]|nr:HAMP domain-containing histidine kinase [Desulfamplus sp.]